MSSRVQRLAGVPRRAASLLVTGTERLRQLVELALHSRKLAEDAVRRDESIDKKVLGVDQDVRMLHAELRALRRELHERMLQYHLQLGRLSRQVDGQREGERSAPRLSGRMVPTTVDATDPLEWADVGGGPAPDPHGREWLTLDACPMCGTADRTIVNEYNKLILSTKAPDALAPRYDYAVCHGCGVLYATRRPIGERFRFLLANFGEVTAKQGGGREIANALLNPYPLSDDDREQLRRRASRGVFVSDHLELRPSEYLDGLLKDRFDNSAHLDVIGTLLEPRGARVLEIRPRTGAISDGLRRLFGAEIHAMPIWQSQQFLLKEVYGIDSAGLIDFDHFDIPYPGKFDLIVANHILTHILRPAEFFALLRERLNPGGHLYLYNEPDDSEFLSGKQSMLATLNPLHMQAFDHRSLRRALAANGFEMVFQRRRRFSNLCLARLTRPILTPMTDRERQRRISAYQRARDRAVLGVREDVRSRFAAEWSQIVERGVSGGLVEFDAKGHLRLVAD